jgi:hypothetical protein
VAQALAAQQPPQAAQTKYMVERLDLVGNRSVRTATLRDLISLNPGDPYASKRFGAMSGPSGILGSSTTYARRRKIASTGLTRKS